MQTTDSQLFNHLTNNSKIPYACRFHFTETPLLWYETERLYFQSTKLYLHGIQIQNPVRVGENWKDEYYLMYYRDLCGGGPDPLDPLYGLEKFEFKERFSNAHSVVVIRDLQTMERDGHSFKRGPIESKLDHLKLKTVPSNLIHTEEELCGVRSRILLANFTVVSVLGIAVR